MMQGDSYSLAVEIRKEDGTIVTDADVSDVEITIGNITKSKSGGSVSYANEVWNFPLSQDETFSLTASRVRAQVRVKWKNGDVEGVVLDPRRVNESISKEVL